MRCYTSAPCGIMYTNTNGRLCESSTVSGAVALLRLHLTCVEGSRVANERDERPGWGPRRGERPRGLPVSMETRWQTKLMPVGCCPGGELVRSRWVGNSAALFPPGMLLCSVYRYLTLLVLVQSRVQPLFNEDGLRRKRQLPVTVC